jgi:hypothetical protein
MPIAPRVGVCFAIGSGSSRVEFYRDQSRPPPLAHRKQARSPREADRVNGDEVTPPSPGEERQPRSWPGRVLGALQLQSDVYEEVADDPAATQQAIALVAICGLTQLPAAPQPLEGGDITLALIGAYLAWLIPGMMFRAVGERALGLKADLPRVLRALGFANAPQLLWLAGGFAPIEASADAEPTLTAPPFLLALGVVILILSLCSQVLALRVAFRTNLVRTLQLFVLSFFAFAVLAVVANLVAMQLGLGG